MSRVSVALCRCLIRFQFQVLHGSESPLVSVIESTSKKFAIWLREEADFRVQLSVITLVELRIFKSQIRFIFYFLDNDHISQLNNSLLKL